MFDTSHPWLRPLWVRVAIVAACLGWAVFELATGAPGWASVFGAVGLYTAWVFVRSGRGEETAATDEED